MNEYYAVVRSTSELAHYGVKGMKWGVRKAIEKGNSKRLARHYAKALRKLDRMNSASDIATNERRLAKNKKIAAIGASIGTVGALSAVNQHLKQNHLVDELRKAKKAMDETTSYSYRDKYINALSNKDYDTYDVMKQQQYDNIDHYYTLRDDLYDRDPKINANKWIGVGLGAAGLGTAAVAGGRAALAKYRTTKKGHAKTVAKRDAFRNAMAETFSDPKAKSLLKKSNDTVQKAKNASIQRNKKETAANKQFAVKKTIKQQKRRARLERKIGKLL